MGRFIAFFRSFLFLGLLCYGVRVPGQQTVPAVLLSDIHFDPFHNPRDLPKLQSSPVEQWPAILNASSSLVQDAERTAMQAECHALSLDTDWPLLKASLVAAHDAQPRPVFVTLSGDLLAHEFRCRFHHIAPSGTPEAYADFAAKTVAFVALQLRLTFPHVPVYVALGNNDSGCADYDETPGNAFLRSATATMTTGATRGMNAGQGRALLEVSPEGDYSVALPAPLDRGRLIVLQDVFDSPYFLVCGGGNERGPEASQIAWLRKQLADARARHQQVWVMGHIPPGIDIYASFHRYIFRPAELCSAELHPFLQDSALVDALLDYADVVRLALFAHTHMDEIRLLHRPPAPPGKAGESASPPAQIAAKLVPSVTPYFGNHPAFLVAAVNPRNLQLADWETFVSPGMEGSTPPWKAAYKFSTAYGFPAFSPETAAALANGFTADRSGKAAHSTTYREHFYAGDLGLYALGLGQIWPAYACAVRETESAGFHQCLCPSTGSSH